MERIIFWKLKNLLKTKWLCVRRSSMLLHHMLLHHVSLHCLPTTLHVDYIMCRYTIFRPHDHMSTAWLISMLLHLFLDYFVLHVVTLFWPIYILLHLIPPSGQNTCRYTYCYIPFSLFFMLLHPFLHFCHFFMLILHQYFPLYYLSILKHCYVVNSAAIFSTLSARKAASSFLDFIATDFQRINQWKESTPAPLVISKFIMLQSHLSSLQLFHVDHMAIG